MPASRLVTGSMTNECTPFSLTSILWAESGRIVCPFNCQMRSGVGRPLTYRRGKTQKTLHRLCLFLLEEFDCYPHVRDYWEYENSLVNLCLSGGDWSPAWFVMGINWTRRRHVSLCRETQDLLCCLRPTWKMCHYYNVHILTKQQTKQW